MGDSARARSDELYIVQFAHDFPFIVREYVTLLIALALDLLIGVHYNWRAKSTHNCVKEGGLLLYLAWAANKQCSVRVAEFFLGRPLE